MITARRGYLVGHFTIYRNVPIVNRLFEHCRDLNQVLQTEQGVAFDECGGCYRPFTRGEPPDRIVSRCDSMTHIVHRAASANLITPFFGTWALTTSEMRRRKWVFRWSNGQLYNLVNRRSAMYVHFKACKNDAQFNCDPWNGLDREFLLTPSGFQKLTIDSQAQRNTAVSGEAPRYEHGGTHHNCNFISMRTGAHLHNPTSSSESLQS